MTEIKKIHNAEDKALRSLSRAFVQGLLDSMGIKSKVKEISNPVILNRNYEDKLMDCLVLLDNNEYLIIEFQSTTVNDDVALRFIDYALSVKKEYNKNCKIAIVYTPNLNLNKNQFQPVDAVILNTTIYKFKNINGDDILEELTNKILNKIKLTDKDLFDLGAILLYSTNRDYNQFAVKVVELVTKIDYLPKYVHDRLISAQLIIANKTVKDSKFREKIRELLYMEKTLLQEEREEGIEIGREEVIAKVVLNMRSLGYDLNQIIEVTGLTKDVIESL